MKMSLLEMVTDILNDMDSDEVNSITDTIESQQVAQIVKTCYFEMLGNRNWPHLRQMFQLNDSGYIDKPNYLKIPDNIKELSFFKYDKFTASNPKTTILDVEYKHPDSFLRLVSSRNSLNANVQTVSDFSGVKLLILKDVPPTYWTSFDDTYIVTDSYDNAVDDTLHASKTQCLGYVEPLWNHENDFIPDLPSEAFSALLSEAKSTAFLALKQVPNQKAEQKANRQNRWLARKAWTANGGIVYPNYGRASRK
jgi:hypothetical protein